MLFWYEFVRNLVDNAILLLVFVETKSKKIEEEEIEEEISEDEEEDRWMKFENKSLWLLY